MARKLVTVDDELRLPPAVETALKEDLSVEFQTAIDTAESSASQATAASEAADQIRSEVLVTQAEIDDLIYTWNADTNDAAFENLASDADSGTGRAIREAGAIMRFADEAARDAYYPAPEDGTAAITGTGASLVEWRYIDGSWVTLATAVAPTQSVSVDAYTGTDEAGFTGSFTAIKDSNGFVDLVGYLGSTPSMPSGSIVAILPEGFRPSSSDYEQKYVVRGSVISATNGNTRLIGVDNDGTIYLHWSGSYGGAAGTGGTGIGMTGVRFKAS